MKNRPQAIKATQFILAHSDVKNGMSIVDACRTNSVSRQTYYKLLKRFEADGDAGLQSKNSTPKTTRKPNKNLNNAIEKIVLSNPTCSITEIADKLTKTGHPRKARSTIHWYLRRLGVASKSDRFLWIESYYKGNESDLNECQLRFLCSINRNYLDIEVLKTLKGLYFQLYILDIGPKFIDDRYLHIVINVATGYAVCVASNIRNSGFLLQSLNNAVIRHNQQFVERLDVVADKAIYLQIEKRTHLINPEKATPAICAVGSVASLGMASRSRVWILEYVEGRSGFKRTDQVVEEVISKWNLTAQTGFPLYSKVPKFKFGT